MPEVNLPQNIKNGDGLDADAVMQNDQTLAQVINGGLEAGSNVTTDAAVTQTGGANASGTASTLARSDHTHILQGFENLTADPSTGNFEGRVFWNSTLNKLRQYDGTTWNDLSPDATTLVIHAAQHKIGGHDPLAANTITDLMKDVRTVYSATCPAVSNISGSSYTNLVDLAVTTTNAQTLAISVMVRLVNTTGTLKSAYVRVIDNTAAGTPTIFRTQGIVLAASGGVDTSVFAATFYYTVPVAGGARTLKLQAGASSATSVNVSDPTTSQNGDATAGAVTPSIQAVIV